MSQDAPFVTYHNLGVLDVMMEKRKDQRGRDHESSELMRLKGSGMKNRMEIT